jgi:hypothetical protein
MTEEERMTTRQDKTNADIAFGEIRGFSHTAGYTRQSAVTRLEWLLETDLWRLTNAGYSDINTFLRDIWQADVKGFRLAPEDRQKLARRIKELQAEASNRAIARALGADERTIRRDLSDAGAAHAARDEINPKEINGDAGAGAALAARRAQFHATVNAARKAEPGAPVGEAEVDAAFDAFESGFDADPPGAFETLRSIIQASALLWARSALEIGRQLRADKTRFPPAQWFMLIDELGYPEDQAEAFMAEAETPVEELADGLIATWMEEPLQSIGAERRPRNEQS